MTTIFSFTTVPCDNVLSTAKQSTILWAELNNFTKLQPTSWLTDKTDLSGSFA